VRLSQNKTGAGGVAQAIEQLLCKYEALSSNPNPTQKKKKGYYEHFFYKSVCGYMFSFTLNKYLCVELVNPE
jgi:hypothetical protein